MRVLCHAATLAVVTALGIAPALADSPRPLSPRGIENATAFARLLSLVRFFHPSDAAAGADWSRVAVAGIDAVEPAGDAPALASALEGYFRPIAPTLRVYPRGERPEIPAELRAPDGPGPFKVVAWRHFGGHFNSKSKVFTSERIDDRSPPGFGTLVQAIAPGRLQGRRVRLRAAVRAEVQPGGFAQLGLRVDRAGGRPGFLDNMADRPIRDASWRVYEIEGEVAPDAERIVVLLVLTGGGKVWLDDVSLEPLDGGPGEPLANAGFEDGVTGKQPPGWHFPYDSVQTGYHLLLRRGEPCRTGGCAEVASDEIAVPRLPRPDEILEADLGGGVAAALPLSLWADAAGTLPHALPGAPAPPWADANPDGDTRAARLAAVALAWGIPQHLHPELDPSRPDWIAALPAALGEAARADDREAFLRALNRMLVPLEDIWTRAGHSDFGVPGVLPLDWAWVENRLVVTGVPPDAPGLRVGDVIATFDGRPVTEALQEAEARVSAPKAATRRWFALRLLTAGKPGSEVTLGIERPGAEPVAVTLARGARTESIPDTPLPAVAEPRPGIVYVDLRRTSDEDLPKLLPRLAAARGIVFDLRGRSDVSTVLLSHLADRTAQRSNWQVPVVMRPDHRSLQWLATFWTIEPKEPRLRGKVAWLIDGRTLAYSETLLAMVEHYRLGTTVGEPSAGGGGNYNWTVLPGGYEMIWTGSRVLKHDDSPWHAVGVTPKVPVSRTLRGIAAGRDEMVERAVGLVSGP
ncbi:MAG TPA: S41 family peptidase [Thermoanaerobaculia bacterium]|nr:S41 family peptidase [Thermoanaerobaculia bacterium]